MYQTQDKSVALVSVLCEHPVAIYNVQFDGVGSVE